MKTLEDVDNLMKVREDIYWLLSSLQLYDLPKPVVEIGPMDEETSLGHFFDSKKVFPDYFSMDINEETNPNIVGSLTDIDKIIGRGTVGTVIACSVLEHVPNVWDVPQAAHNVLKTNGIFAIEVPFNLRFHGPRPDCWRITDDGIHALFGKLFDIEIFKSDETLKPASICAMMRKK